MSSLTRSARLSFLAATLALISLCIGVLPIPLMDFVCYPFSIAGGLFAMVSGWMAVRQLPPGKWRGFTHFNIWMSGLVVLFSACFFAFSLLILPLLWNGGAYVGQTLLPAAAEWFAQTWQALLQWLSQTGWVN